MMIFRLSIRRSAPRHVDIRHRGNRILPISFWVHWGTMLGLISSRLSLNGRKPLSPQAGDGDRTTELLCETRFFSCWILDFSFRNISCDLPLGVFPFPSFFRKARVCESQSQYHLRRLSTLMKARLRITIDGHEFEPDRPCQEGSDQKENSCQPTDDAVWLETITYPRRETIYW